MNTGNRKVEFNVEEKLSELNLTPFQRARAVGHMRKAEGWVEAFLALTSAIKRVAGTVSLKPSARA